MSERPAIAGDHLEAFGKLRPVTIPQLRGSMSEQIGQLLQWPSDLTVPATLHL